MLCWVPIVGLIIGIVCLVLSIIAVAKNYKRGCGVGGIVTSAIGTLIGFIVVISTVALAPQVSKYIDNSRNSNDMLNYNSLVSAANLALTSEDVLKEVQKGDIIITLSDKGVMITQNGIILGSNSSFFKSMKLTLGDDFVDSYSLKGSLGDSFVITVCKEKNDYVVKKTSQPSRN